MVSRKRTLQLKKKRKAKEKKRKDRERHAKDMQTLARMPGRHT